MVKKSCFNFLVLVLGLCCVSAYHPIPQSISPSGQNEGNEGPSTQNSAQADLLRLEKEVGKRGPDRNFLRFGKSDSSLENSYYPPDNQVFTEEEKKAVKNFLRFGRVGQKNFLRFGRSGSPLAFGLGLEPEETEEFLRREDPQLYRLAKAADRNFIRFGRSTKNPDKIECKNCIKEGTEKFKALSNHGRNVQHSLESQDNKNRHKRAVAAFYDDAEFFPHAHMSWNSPQFTEMELPPGFVTGNENDMMNAQKRAHGRSFLRYGRDPLDLHFLRFGKRSSSEEDKSPSIISDEDFHRYVRGRTTKNFIRFG